jgi:hypothetical protein
MTHSEALKLALDALGKWSSGRDMDAVQLNDLIATLEAALEQPEQEPVADSFTMDELTEAAVYAEIPDGPFQSLLIGLQEAIKRRAALEQPEQEPLAWLESPYGSIRMNTTMRFQFPPQSLKWKIPLYTHPPQRKPLTDEEILLDEVLRYHFGCNGGAGPVSQKGIKIIRAIERAHGIGGEA